MAVWLFLWNLGWFLVAGTIIALAFYWIIKTFEPAVTVFLNRIWLPSVIPYPLVEDEEVQLVIDKNLTATATWATISASFKLGMAGFISGVLFVGAEYLFRLYDLAKESRLGESVQEFDLSLFPIGFLLPFLILPFVYWLRAWRAKASRLVVTNRALILLNVNIPILGVDFQVSQGSVVIAKEILAGIDVDQLIKSNPALKKKHPDLMQLTGGGQDLFNRLLAKKHGTGVLVIPSAMDFATDVFEAADHAVATSFVIRQIAIASEQAGLGGPLLFASTNLSRGDLQAVPANTDVIDLLTVQDPGIWNRRTTEQISTPIVAGEGDPWESFR